MAARSADRDARPAADDAPPEGDAAAIDLAVPEIALPAAEPAISRSELGGLGLATLLHLAVLAAFLAPERRLGAGGLELESIGVEIVTVAPALDARADARGRGSAGETGPVSDREGAQVTQPEETGARDSRTSETPKPQEAAAAPADIVVPDWVEPPKPPDPAANDPIIAPIKGAGEAPDAKREMRPSLEDAPMSVADSIPAAELIAQQEGGAAARGKETVDVAQAVMAAARAGRRDAYQLSLFETIKRHPPRRVIGAIGEVKVEFRVQRDGRVAMARIVKSSGSRPLDDAVINAIRGAPFPIPPNDIGEDQLFYDMSFTFR